MKRVEVVAAWLFGIAFTILGLAVTVETVLGHPVTWAAAAQAFVFAFERVLELELIPSALTEQELGRAGELMQEKYANDQWTRKS